MLWAGFKIIYMATNREIQKGLEKKGWKFTVYMSGRGVQATKGSRKVVGTSFTDVFRKIRGY
jgi:hypothetical protein